MKGWRWLLRISRRGDFIALPAFCTCVGCGLFRQPANSSPNQTVRNLALVYCKSTPKIVRFGTCQRKPLTSNCLIQRSAHDPRIARPCGGWNAPLSFRFNFWSSVDLTSAGILDSSTCIAPVLTSIGCHPVHITYCNLWHYWILAKALCTHPAKALYSI